MQVIFSFIGCYILLFIFDIYKIIYYQDGLRASKKSFKKKFPKLCVGLAPKVIIRVIPNMYVKLYQYFKRRNISPIPFI